MNKIKRFIIMVMVIAIAVSMVSGMTLKTASAAVGRWEYFSECGGYCQHFQSLQCQYGLPDRAHTSSDPGA